MSGIVFLHLILKIVCLSAVFHATKGRMSMLKLETLCGFHDRVGQGCSTLDSAHDTSVLDCAKYCLQYDECEGFVLVGNLACYLLRHCYNVSSKCVNEDRMYTYYRRLPTATSCLNTGAWNAKAQACRCTGGFVGLRCERYATSCRDLHDNGYPPQTRKRTFIKPPGFPAPFLTNCAIGEGEIRTDIVHQMRNVRNNNSRPWADYVDGYYGPDDSQVTRDLWLGLEKMRYLNDAYNLKSLVMAINFNNDNLNVWFYYRGVRIGDAAANYTLTYDEVTVNSNNLTLSNCLPTTGSAFSTPDADNDEDPHHHCAKAAGAGWWFSRCSPDITCNPLGNLYETGQENVTDTRMRFDGCDLRKLAADFHHFRMYFSEYV